MTHACRSIVTYLAAFLLSACATSARPPANAPDLMPMYGGMDRAAVPMLKRADDQFIADVSKQFGSREHASELWVEQGMRFYLIDDYAHAMRRFNQAWLLNPNNPSVYWGFAVVYHDQGRIYEAKDQIDLALQHGLQKPIALADAGRIITLCATRNDFLGDADRQAAYGRS